MKILLKGGNSTSIAGYTGVGGEILVDQDSSMIHVMDGVTAGGHTSLRIEYTIGAASIISPISGATQIVFQPTIQGGAFDGMGAHYASYWEIATNNAFTNIVYASGMSLVNLLSINLATLGVTLNGSTVYYVRVKYQSDKGLITEWSPSVYFTTKPPAIAGAQLQKLLSSDIATGDQFGTAVALSLDGATMVVGANTEDVSGSDSGCAYIFIKSGATWVQQAKLAAADGAMNDWIGSFVAISNDGNTVLVSSHMDDDLGANSGSVYVFVRSGSTWSQQAKLTASDGAATDYFGYSVSLSSDGNRAIIGAHGDDDGASMTGSAYVYLRSGTTWAQQAKLAASDRSTLDYFGRSVAISDDGFTAIVGAYGNDDNGSESGSAYIFTRSGTTWTQRVKLLASDAAAGDLFGIYVSISSNGDTVLIGASGDDSSKGAAYVFTGSGASWSQQAKLVATDGTAGNQLGYFLTLAADGNTAVIGAYLDNDNGSNSGSAYIFLRDGTTWSQHVKLLASDGAASDKFGGAVGISRNGSVAAVGAYGDNSNAGAIYVFT